MMKKILALLLAVMLLPAAALAETYGLEFSVTMNAENAVDVIKSTGLFAGSNDEDGLCAAFVDLIDGIALRIVAQEDAASVALTFDETNLFDLSVLTGGEDVIILSELLNGTGFKVSKAALAEADAEDDAFVQLMENTDWISLVTGMFSAAMEKMDGVQVTTQRGSFSGDAYSGGVFCTTITFDDAAIAAMLGAMLTDDARALVKDLGAYWEFDGEAVIRSIEEANTNAAQENAHRYILRLVYDAEETLIGASAVVMSGSKQLGTLSLGFGAEKLTIVAGFGLDDVNYWHCQEIAMTMTEGDDGMTTIALKGSIEEYTAPKDEDFAFAAATKDSTLYDLDWTAELNLQGGNATWKYASERQLSGAAATGMKGQGMYLNGKRMTNSCTYLMGGKEYMTERLVWAPCAALDLSAEGVTLIDLTAVDDTAMSEVAFALGNELATRLLQVIPMKLILFLQ